MAIVTLCFVKQGNKLAMINRHKSPFMGMWNALGGHLEENESIEQCAIREIYEESGIKVDHAALQSISTWNLDDDIIYVFVSNLNEDYPIANFPFKINEGIIDLKDIDWIIHPKNFGIVPDLRVFIQDIKEGHKKNYHLVYTENGNFIEAILKEKETVLL